MIGALQQRWRAMTFFFFFFKREGPRRFSRRLLYKIWKKFNGGLQAENFDFQKSASLRFYRPLPPWASKPYVAQPGSCARQAPSMHVPFKTPSGPSWAPSGLSSYRRRNYLNFFVLYRTLTKTLWKLTKGFSHFWQRGGFFRDRTVSRFGEGFLVINNQYPEMLQLEFFQKISGEIGAFSISACVSLRKPFQAHLAQHSFYRPPSWRSSKPYLAQLGF